VSAPARLAPDQIGILTGDLEEAMHRYSQVFACGPWSVWTYGPTTMSESSFRGQPGCFEMRLALAGTGPQLELIQPLRGPSIYDEWLEEHGEGLHHIGTRVADLDHGVSDARARGFEVIQSGRGYGLDGDGGFAYLDTASQLGIILELIEVPARRREPEAVVEPSG
jgi:methylmalonyl-CoA/ethylmalonyl-CoA epimerase